MKAEANQSSAVNPHMQRLLSLPQQRVQSGCEQMFKHLRFLPDQDGFIRSGFVLFCLLIHLSHPVYHLRTLKNSWGRVLLRAWWRFFWLFKQILFQNPEKETCFSATATNGSTLPVGWQQLACVCECVRARESRVRPVYSFPLQRPSRWRPRGIVLVNQWCCLTLFHTDLDGLSLLLFFFFLIYE